MTRYPETARIMAMMPKEKLSTSISNPAPTFPSTSLSNRFTHQPAKGPIIMAPRNMGVSVPMMTPMAATAPATPPLYPQTFFPAVNAMRVGRRYFSIGETILAMLSLGHHPPGMKRAVMRPHAMNAPIFGMTIALRLRPNFCICSLIKKMLVVGDVPLFLAEWD